VLTIKQAAVRHLDEPQLLPDLFPSLKKEGIRFRRGQVTMIAGQPNSGKSLLAFFMASKLMFQHFTFQQTPMPIPHLLGLPQLSQVIKQTPLKNHLKTMVNNFTLKNYHH